jgi:tetratricopeptide (TPR) repeat protein
MQLASLIGLAAMYPACAQALSLEPSASTYAARSNAHIKQENYVEAAQDANKALELDPQHSKAYLRKGYGSRFHNNLVIHMTIPIVHNCKA